MKKVKKISVLIFFLILGLGIFVFISAFTPTPNLVWGKEVDYPAIPGAESITEGTTLPQYINYIFNAALWIGGILCLAMIIWGGFVIMTAGGSIAKAKDGRERIIYAIGGLFLLLASYLILYTINPELTVLKLPEIAEISLPEYNDGEIPQPTEPQYEIEKLFFGGYLREAMELERESAEKMRQMVCLSVGDRFKDECKRGAVRKIFGFDKCRCEYCIPCIAQIYVEIGCIPCFPCFCTGKGPEELCPKNIYKTGKNTLDLAERITKNANDLENALEGEGKDCIRDPSCFIYDYVMSCCPDPPLRAACPSGGCDLEKASTHFIICPKGEDCKLLILEKEDQDLIKEAIEAQRETAEIIREMIEKIRDCSCKGYGSNEGCKYELGDGFSPIPGCGSCGGCECKWGYAAVAELNELRDTNWEDLRDRAVGQIKDQLGNLLIQSLIGTIDPTGYLANKLKEALDDLFNLGSKGFDLDLPCNPKIIPLMYDLEELADLMEENADELEHGVSREKLIKCAEDELKGKATLNYCPFEDGLGCPEACKNDPRDCELTDFVCIRKK